MPVLFPTRMFPYVGEVLIPVPPKAVESVEVAETVPLMACKAPVRFPIVILPLESMENAASVDVAKVVGEEVEM